MSIDRISALLAQAEGTDNEAEAQAYMRKAQMLATTYSIDLAVARANVAKSNRREVPEVKRMTLAPGRGKDINKHLIALMAVIVENNDLRMNIMGDSTGVILFGYPTDQDVAEALFASLAHQMVESADRYIRKGEWKGQTYEAQVRQKGWYGETYTDYIDKTYTARTARNAFYSGWITKINSRLREARQAAINERIERDRLAASLNPAVAEAPAEAVTGTELVLKTKKREVGDFYKQKSNARGTWKGSSGARGGVAASSGRDAAARARITSQRGISGMAGSIAS